MKKAFTLCLTLVLGLVLRVPAQNAENLLRPGDSIVLKLSGVPSDEIAIVSNSYDISENGTINLPYIGEIRASGMRPSQLQRSIEAAYKSGEIYTHPTILISANNEHNITQVVYVSGEVKNPKQYPIAPGMSVGDAITTAGGPSDFGNMRRVKLTRNGATRELDLRKVDNPDAAILVLPGDRVMVPK